MAFKKTNPQDFCLEGFSFLKLFDFYEKIERRKDALVMPDSLGVAQEN